MTGINNVLFEFAEYYKDVAKPHNAATEAAIAVEVDELITVRTIQENMSYHTPVTVSMLEKCISKLKRNKATCLDNISTVIAGQFAFKPTGSTTCALIFFMHHVTRLLEDNSYVRCLLIDFTKAFGVVDHGILVSKLFRLNIPPCILQSISCFLTGRTQQVKYATKLSAFQPINMGIVQGSGLGPTLYIVLESDLETISKN